MRVLVVGVGAVGTALAADLAEGHDVVAIDVDGDRVDAVSTRYDVLGVHGDGTDPDVLDEAGVDEADVVVTATDDDETNLTVCGSVTAISDAFTVALVEESAYLRAWRRSRGAYGADYLLDSTLRAARAISRLVDLPRAHEFEELAGGNVHVAEFEVAEGSPLAGRDPTAVGRSDCAVVSVLRDGAVDVLDPLESADADADTETGIEPLAAGDRVVVVGAPGGVENVAADVVADEDVAAVEDVVVLGSSATGRQVAHLLEERGRPARVVVESHERARDLADDLSETTLLVHDPTDPDFLEREHVGDADVVVVARENDQRGLLTSMLARSRGADRTVTVVDSAQYDVLFEEAGVDVAVHPRAEAAEEIARFTRGRRTENVVFVGRDGAEVFEVAVVEESLAAGHTLADLMDSLPDGTAVGALTRDGEYVAPDPDFELQAGDHVVVFARADVSDRALDQF
ncbi:Trk system potassium transporter TrkA [Halospeciosus flavus]|uniref:Trk system potassium transporter TrkA n=1 Tax=Halospeciosus flavus TaxID=3032283 RepID=A0ABD5Z0R6_9EURY|nr:Trk system potassium transporter TrkA [Halospeciosus flavus]